MKTPVAQSFEQQMSVLRIASADAGDGTLDAGVQALLALVRDHLRMDVVFVAEFVDGFRLIRHAHTGPIAASVREAVVADGQAQPLADTLCQRVLDGRLPPVVNDLPAMRATHKLPEFPFPVGAYLGVPVVREDGSVYGALCCFTLEPDSSFGELELKRLQMSARLVAQLLQQ